MRSNPAVKIARLSRAARALSSAGGISMLALLLAGCGTVAVNEQARNNPRAIRVAKFASVPVKVDGVLDDAVWQMATVYRFVAYPFDNNREAKSPALTDGGEAMLAWDDEYLYIAVKLMDADIVAEGEQDQLSHFKMGDVAEVFIKPADKTWYWELYATPRGKKSNYFYPGRGRLGLESPAKYSCGLKVAAKVDGTLNNWEDKDRYWTAELAMPVKDLTARGEKFGPGSNWIVLIARYNYSVNLPFLKELSAAVPMPSWLPGGFQANEGWAELRFEK